MNDFFVPHTWPVDLSQRDMTMIIEALRHSSDFLREYYPDDDMYRVKLNIEVCREQLMQAKTEAYSERYKTVAADHGDV